MLLSVEYTIENSTNSLETFKVNTDSFFQTYCILNVLDYLYSINYRLVQLSYFVQKTAMM